MMKRRTLVLMLLLLSGGALADDFVGQASVIDGDTLEIHGIRIRLWGIDAPESSQLCRGDDSLQYRCGAQAANDLDTFIAGRPVNCPPLSPTPMAGRLRPARSAAPISANGLCARAWRWICPNTRRVDTTALSATPNAQAWESGKAATSSRGSTAPVSERTESQPRVQMTPTLIRDLSSRRTRSSPPKISKISNLMRHWA
jgi:hypothetical protein